MKIIKVISIYILFNFLFIANLLASQPEWIKKIPAEDNRYRYYIGRGYSSESEYEAMKEATQDAYTQALRVFGTKVKMSNEIYQTEKEVKGTIRMTEKINTEVNFEDFDLIDQYISSENNKYNVWVLYRFSKEAINKEKERLKNIKTNDNNTNFSVYGNVSNIKNGILEVITEPSNANVLIDNEPYGKTPLKIIGQLEPGKHKIEINNLFYEPIIEDVIIVPNKTVRIEKKLNKEKTKLNINTTPNKAKIIINGISVGKSPIKNFEVNTGDTLTFEITHPETFKMIEERTITKDKNETINFELNKKPVIVSLETIPSDASVFFNNDFIGKTPLENEPIVPKEENNLIIKKAGYKTYKILFDSKGGETIHYPIIEMENGHGLIEEKEKKKINKGSYSIGKVYLGYTKYNITDNIKNTNTNYTFYKNKESSDNGVFGIAFGFPYKNFEFSIDVSFKMIKDLEYITDIFFSSLALKIDYFFNNKTPITPFFGVGTAFDIFTYNRYNKHYSETEITKATIGFSTRAGLRLKLSEEKAFDFFVEKKFKNDWIDNELEEYKNYYVYGEYEDISYNIAYIFKF